MIIRNEADVTHAVLTEIERADDPRFRELLSAAVRHLHALIREVKLTEAEFQQACAAIARLGQATTASHNEVVLCAGSLGVSQLVCLLNNDTHFDDGTGMTENRHGTTGARGTTANLLGPFWREGSPRMNNGDSIVRGATSARTFGDAIFVDAWVHDVDGNPVAGADVDVWHTSSEGLYENQDPSQPDMNLRGTFTTDADGHIAFRSVKPAGYPIPVNGPVGDLLRAQHRHNMRPSHIHFLIYKEGYKTQFSQVYSSDDPYLETDVQFGVTEALIAKYVRHEPGSGDSPPAADITGLWYTVEHRFVIAEGLAKLPRAPITGKSLTPTVAAERIGGA